MQAIKKTIHPLLISIGSIFGAFFMFATYVLITRQLNIYEFGLWSVSIVTVTILSSFVGFGLSGFLLEFSSRDDKKIFKWISGSKDFILVSAIIVLIFLLGWSLFGPHNDEMSNILLILAPYMAGQIAIDLVNSKLQIEKKYLHVAVWQFFPQLLRFISVIILNSYPEYFNVKIIAYIFTFSAIVVAILGVILLCGTKCKKVMPEKIRMFDVIKVVKKSWLFGASGVLYFVYFQSDIIILKYLINEESAAIYNVAFIVMLAIYLIPSVLGQKYLLPKVYYLYYNDFLLLKRKYNANSLKLFMIGVVVAIFLWMVMPYIVLLLFGDKYQQSIILIWILLLAIPMRFVTIFSGMMLMTSDYIKKKVALMSVVALFNIVFNFLLIPMYGALGAAIVTILSEFILMFLYVFSIKKYVL